jgi:hypothetical protein
MRNPETAGNEIKNQKYENQKGLSRVGRPFNYFGKG